MSNKILSNETLPTIETATLATVQGGWVAPLVGAALTVAGFGHSKGQQKHDGRPWESAKDLVDPRNKANWPRVLPVVGGAYSAGRLLYKAGEAVGRS